MRSFDTSASSLSVPRPEVDPRTLGGEGTMSSNRPTIGNGKDAPAASGVPSVSATAPRAEEEEELMERPFDSLAVDGGSLSASFDSLSEDAVKVVELQRENDELKKKLKKFEKKLKKFEYQNKDLRLENEYYKWNYSAEDIPPSYWTSNGYHEEYAAGMRGFLNQVKAVVHQLRCGAKIERILFGGTFDIQLLHHHILLPHWQEFVNGLHQYEKFSHRKDHGIESLRFEYINLHTSVLEMLLPALKVASVKCLQLHLNRFQGNGGVSFVSEVASSNAKLAELVWDANRIETVEDMQLLCSSLVGNPCNLPKRLRLSEAFYDNDPEMLQAVLTSCSCQASMYELHLNPLRTFRFDFGVQEYQREDELHYQRVQHIANFLATNPRLLTFGLDETVRNDNAEVLANALPSNTRLEHLVLFQISEIDRKHLLRALFNTTDLNSCAASNHTCQVHAMMPPDIAFVNRFEDSKQNRSMKIFTILAVSDQGFFDVSCLGDCSYKLIPMVLELAQYFTEETPELSSAYEEQTGRKSADWDKLEVSSVPLTSVFELLRSWAVPALETEPAQE